MRLITFDATASWSFSEAFTFVVCSAGFQITQILRTQCFPSVHIIRVLQYIVGILSSATTKKCFLDVDIIYDLNVTVSCEIH